MNTMKLLSQCTLCRDGQTLRVLSQSSVVFGPDDQSSHFEVSHLYAPCLVNGSNPVPKITESSRSVCSRSFGILALSPFTLEMVQCF